MKDAIANGRFMRLSPAPALGERPCLSTMWNSRLRMKTKIAAAATIAEVATIAEAATIAAAATIASEAR